jgi:hypothetical protein
VDDHDRTYDLPSGLGFFAEVQDESQRTRGEITREFIFFTAYCPACPRESIHTLGRSDRELFRRSEKRVHLGAGYRLRIASEIDLEATGGLTRIRLDQTVARSLDTHGDICSPLLSREYILCTYPLFVGEKKVQSATSWGYHLGANLAVFPAKHIGFGLGVRYFDAGKAVLDGLDGFSQSGEVDRTPLRLRLGGLSVNAGLRIRL